ncbi:hypothetical protein HJG60_011000 [Phyllostomus discolor]|uniref:Uncharacterized protein n=1 Tax=Phyllostomus discolor TaxID=89673 RepID=A0A834A7E2_9CHIR|nr:hypothetical protein HJG60_011000 [Phyllostomus discolor]
MGGSQPWALHSKLADVRRRTTRTAGRVVLAAGSLGMQMGPVGAFKRDLLLEQGLGACPGASSVISSGHEPQPRPCSSQSAERCCAATSVRRRPVWLIATGNTQHAVLIIALATLRGVTYLIFTVDCKGGTITPISQMRKLRPKEGSDVSKATRPVGS